MNHSLITAWFDPTANVVTRHPKVPPGKLQLSSFERVGVNKGNLEPI